MEDALAEDDVKPKVTEEEVLLLLDKYYGMREPEIVQLNGYDDLNYLCSHSLVDNSNVPSVKSLFVLKIMNSLDSEKVEFCEAQNSLMLFLDKNGRFQCPVPVKNLQGEYYVKEKFPLTEAKKEIRKEHIVRLLKYIPGVLIKDVTKSYLLFCTLGKALAELDNNLQNFHHPFYLTHQTIWHLRSAPKLTTMTNIIEDPDKRSLVEKILREFVDKVQPLEATFEQGMIHGDFNEHNVLMSLGQGTCQVTGILDFGDSHRSCYLFELAIALCYMMFECKRQNLEPVIGAGQFLAGYLSLRRMPNLDLRILRLCICTRICQSLILGLKAFKLNPKNRYVLDSQNIGWILVKEIWEIPDEEIVQKWNFYIAK